MLRKAPDDVQPRDGDTHMVVGDPRSIEVLREAGAHRAEAVLAAMMVDDSENTFVILAVKELGGGERIAMVLSGEEVTPDFVVKHVLQRDGERPGKP